MRKWREDNKIAYKPAYFSEEKLPEDDTRTYWMYNSEYWENDRLKQEWPRSFDIYTDNLPFKE